MVNMSALFFCILGTFCSLNFIKDMLLNVTGIANINENGLNYDIGWWNNFT